MDVPLVHLQQLPLNINLLLLQQCSHGGPCSSIVAALSGHSRRHDATDQNCLDLQELLCPQELPMERIMLEVRSNTSRQARQGDQEEQAQEASSTRPRKMKEHLSLLRINRIAGKQEQL
jgi:hypothetical protein